MTVHLEGIEDFSNLQNENKEKLIVIDFFAKWCGPCKRIATAYEELQTVFPNVVFVKVDVDVAEDLTKKFKVSSMPTFVFVKDGIELERMSGVNLSKLIMIVQKYESIENPDENEPNA